MTKIAAALDELIINRDTLKTEIKEKQKQLKTTVNLIKQIQRVTDAEPVAPKRKRSRKSAAASTSGE